MASHMSIAESDDSSDSRPSIVIIGPEGNSTSSSSSSSSSSGPNTPGDWNRKYRKLPKKRSLALRFMTWTAGRPRNAEYMKKQYRDDDVDSELFRVSTSTLIGSMLGRWPRETKMYWVTAGDDEAGRGGEQGNSGNDDQKDGVQPPRMFMMGGGSGDGVPPMFTHVPGGNPPPISHMNSRYPMAPRFPPGMGGIPPPA